MTRKLLQSRPSALSSKEDFFDIFQESKEGNTKPQTRVEPDDQNKEKKAKKQEKLTRQTFMISEADLDKLKDFVYTKRIQGVYNYSQKMAIRDALQLLFTSVEKIDKRPEDLD